MGGFVTDKLCLSGHFHRMDTVATADSVSLQMNTIMSHDQFKPVRLGEKIVVNYK